MTPVQYSGANKVIVEAFENLSEDLQTANYWSDDAVKPVRSAIKDHYIADQQYVCVYCGRQHVTINKSLWDAEHVISRANASRFMFTPQNLAVSCRDCNIEKAQKEVRNTTRKKFPNESKHYLIVHPHFDSYEEHIRWFGDVCAPLTDKGAKTLVMCNLTRFSTTLLGIEGALITPGFDKQVGELLKAKNKTDAKAALAAISVYVERISQE